MDCSASADSGRTNPRKAATTAMPKLTTNAEILQLDPVDSCSLRHDLLPGLQNVIVFDTLNQNDNSCQLDPFSAAVRVYGRVGAMRSCKIC